MLHQEQAKLHSAPLDLHAQLSTAIEKLGRSFKCLTWTGEAPNLAEPIQSLIAEVESSLQESMFHQSAAFIAAADSSAGATKDILTCLRGLFLRLMPKAVAGLRTDKEETMPSQGQGPNIRGRKRHREHERSWHILSRQMVRHN